MTIYESDKIGCKTTGQEWPASRSLDELFHAVRGVALNIDSWLAGDAIVLSRNDVQAIHDVLQSACDSYYDRLSEREKYLASVRKQAQAKMTEDEKEAFRLKKDQ